MSYWNQDDADELSEFDDTQRDEDFETEEVEDDEDEDTIRELEVDERGRPRIRHRDVEYEEDLD